MATIVPRRPAPQACSAAQVTLLGAGLAIAFLVACQGARPDGDPADPTNGAKADNEAAAVRPPAPLPEGMASYTQQIPGTKVSFDMIAIPGGTFPMGSPDGETGRNADEGPVHEVAVNPFWMGKCEVTWDEYELWAYELDRSPKTAAVDAVSRPTPPYCDMTFGMGHDGYPAICMTQLAARTYCEWLSAKTGHTYRLPTEAEWEYACRAGTSTPYSFGSGDAKLAEHAWFVDNSDEEYHPVGKLAPNPWGLHDMHGNVSEWVLDQHLADFYATSAQNGVATNPLATPTVEYPRVVRGGSWEDPAEMLRSAARRGSHEDWKDQDPQIPKSIWYHTDATFVGFRVVRPYDADSASNPSSQAQRKP